MNTLYINMDDFYMTFISAHLKNIYTKTILSG